MDGMEYFHFMECYIETAMYVLVRRKYTGAVTDHGLIGSS